MDELSAEYVFFKMPLYSPFLITGENFEAFKHILTFSLGSYDKNAVEGNNPFLGNKPTTFVGYGHPGGEDFEYILKYGGLRGTSIRCVRDGHILTYYFHFDSKTNKFMKVGQFPSVADFQIQDLKKYRSVLSKDKLRELGKAVGLAANGVGIGSFVYLRRIFEDLIQEAYELAFKEQKVDAEMFRKERMDGKIVLLTDYLPEFLLKNKALYSIMSLGIHSLSEEDCLMHFDAVKVGIELILDEKVERLQRVNKLKEANQKIEAINQSLRQKINKQQ
ncbi:hypothetical protein GS399_19100 [Pedobacter sp. HMF7647]|uniref:Uncharacterized protein n=1 Tax=Hufsiella arboris TaxID=2695275 RepID=A0A7K1YEQ1_9SPHI|nr:hypothetical protein [Hufsiella arboris]MXV53083.1 hypothetical protein [Hufsiella arboris]